MMNETALTISSIANGAINERFQEELSKVIKNIEDPNTEAKTKRKIVITLELTPNETRDIVSTKINTKSNLAPSYSIGTNMFVGRENGKTICYEISKQAMPGQLIVDNVTGKVQQSNQFEIS